MQETINKIALRFKKRSTIINSAPAPKFNSDAAPDLIIDTAPSYLIKEIHLEFARAVTWLRCERYDWFAEGMCALFRKCISFNLIGEEIKNITDHYVMYESVWHVIESFWQCANKRKVACLREWLKREYHVCEYLKNFAPSNWEEKNKIFKAWLIDGFNSPESVCVLVSSPTFDPLEIDTEPAKELIVPAELVAKELELKNNNRASCLSILVEEDKSYNSFEDSDDDIKSVDPPLNDEYSISPVPVPVKRKLSPPRNNKKFEMEIEESDLHSPRPGIDCYPSAVYTKYTKLSEPFLNYTSPPGFPIVPSYSETPLEEKKFNLNFTDKTNRPWNKKSYQENFRFKPTAKKFFRKMKAKAEAKLERRNDDEKKDPDTIAIPVGDVLEKPAIESDIISKAVQLWRSIPLPQIQLSGGMKQAVPPHLRQVRRVADSLSGGIGAWFHRNIIHTTVHRGAGFIEHRYNLNTPAPFPITPAAAPFAARIAEFAMRHAVESTHKDYNGGVIPRLQYIFRVGTGGAMKRSRVAPMSDIDSLRLLLANLYMDADDIWGSDPLSEDDDNFFHAMHVLVPQYNERGGCDSRCHTNNFGDYKIRTMKSSGNNCGIACLQYYTKSTKQQNTIRRECKLEPGTELSFADMELVAKNLNVGFRIWDVEAGILSVKKSFGLELETVPDILFNRITKHYNILQLVNAKQQCTLCGSFIRNKEKHICNDRKINFYRHFKKKNMEPAAEFKKIKELKRDLSEVYVFDLETFPFENNIHTPYACKIQNVETKKEWMRYGNKETMRDILELSSRYTPVQYIDCNPETDYGKIKYKFAGDKKWKYKEYSPPEYTQAEAVREAYKFITQILNNQAYGEGARIHTDDDPIKKLISIRNVGGGVIGKWSYDDSKSKPNIEKELKGMKDYYPCVFIAHNLARFDGSFLLNYLLSVGIEPTFVINGGRILSLRWNKSEVWDTYLFINDSLKNIAKQFKCKVQKGDFDHHLIKTWQDVETYKEQSPGGMGWRPYLDCDVYSLREIVEIYSKNVYDQFGIDVFKYVTLSSMTYKLWGASTLEQNIVVETPQLEKYKFIKDSIFGGRVFPMQKEFATNALELDEQNELRRIHGQLEEGKKLEEIKYDPEDIKEMYRKCYDSGSFLANMDINSLYPTAMCMDYPVGLGEWSKNPERDFNSGYIGIYHVEFIAPRNLIMAILPQRNKEYVSGFHDETLNKRWKSSGIKWSLEKGEGVYTSVDLHTAIKYGYKLKFKPRAMIWREKEKVFKKYIEEIYKVKKQQDKNKGTPQYNPILRAIAKNMMNALFGKTCQKPIQDEQRIIKNEKEFYEFAKDYEIADYVWVKIKEEKCLAVSGTPLEISNTKPSHLGAFVLAYSRKIMTEDFDRATNKLSEVNFTYTDTDSLHLKGNIYKQMLVDYPERFGPELGQFSNDIDIGVDSIIVYEYCLAPKCYMYVYISKDGLVGLKKKVKGLPKSIMQKISMDDFAEENTRTLHFDSLKKNMFKENQPFTIENTTAQRTFLKNKWNKMLYVPELKQYRPFGYDETITAMDVFLEEEKIEEEKNDNSHRVFQTGLSDKWYFRQEPALSLKKPRLVCWLNQTGFNKKDTRHYSRLNIKDMTKVLFKMKEEGAYLYEITEDFCRLFCDIDLEKKWDDETEPKEILGQVCECIFRAAKMFDVVLGIEDLKILSACTEKKFSFHISSPAHIFPNPGCQKQFWLAVAEIMKEYPKLLIEDKPAVDLPIYHHHRCMRTIYSRKPNKQVLEPVDINCNVLNITQEEIESYFIIGPEKEFSKLSRAPVKKFKRSSKASLILQPNQTLPQDIQSLLKKNKDLLQGFDLENGTIAEHIVRLQRIEPGLCSSCERIHEHESGYINMKDCCFVCFRQPEHKCNLIN